ncbi:tRNA-dihydrouridine synthase, partial [Gemmatimonadota bacterium]
RDRLELALEHARMMVAQRGEFHGVVVMRKHFASYSRGLAEGAQLRRKLFAAESLNEVEELFERYLEETQCVPG